jgi:hypothetical protein
MDLHTSFFDVDAAPTDPYLRIHEQRHFGPLLMALKALDRGSKFGLPRLLVLSN